MRIDCDGGLTIFMLVLVVHVASAAYTGSGDPRCPADFDPLKSCPSSMILPGGAGFDLKRNVDPTSCNDQENCPRCLGDDAWQQKMINEIGLYSAVRDASFKPWIQIDNWLSHEITSTIAMILLREAMNISARASTAWVDGNMAFICCTETVLNMEQWSTGGTFLNDTLQQTTTAKPTGYIGQSGLYVLPHTIEKYPLAFTYQAYRLLPDYQHIFPPSFSTACSNMTANASKGCVSGDYVCETNVWANTTCYDGQWYVPPQCNVAGELGNSSTTHCQEVWMNDPTLDSAVVEGMFKNNGLNMTAAYLGQGRHVSMVKDALARKQDIIFYWYYPDPLVTLLQATRVEFPVNTADCDAERTSDPTLNTAKCDFPLVTFQKRTQTAALNSHPDYKHFFDFYTMSQDTVNAMLSQHTSGGGNSTSYQVACNWVKNNFDTWKTIVQNTPPTSQLKVVSSDLLDNKGLLAAIIVIPILFAAAVVGGCAFLRVKRYLSVKYAPLETPFALIFTDIENSTMLWEACGDDMGTAVEIHHAIIRKHIEEFNAYEVKTIGDCFMIACNSLGDATMLCLAIQTSLGECRDFPAALRFEPNDNGVVGDINFALDASEPQSEMTEQAKTKNPGGQNKFGAAFHYPLRIRIGLHWCQDANVTKDRLHGRYDYYGHDVNVCGRVEAMGIGGQIVVTAETMEAIIDTDEYPIMIAPDTLSAIVKRNVELKGLSVKATLYGLAPIGAVDSGYVPSKAIADSRPQRRSRSGVSSSLGFSSVSEAGMNQGSLMETKSVAASANYSTALLRAAFKAVPDEFKAPWLAAVAKLLRVKGLKAGASDRLDQAKNFDLIKSAVVENCTASLHATHSQSAGGGSTEDHSRNNSMLHHSAVQSVSAISVVSAQSPHSGTQSTSDIPSTK